MSADVSQYLELLKTIYLFKKADEAQLLLVLDGIAVKVYDKDEEIFEQDKPASDFYIVISGAVENYKIHRNKLIPLGTLKRGDVFGFEMLEYKNHCLTTAVALQETKVLLITREHMRKLLGAIPTLNQDLQILYESYVLCQQTSLNWKNPEEVVYFIRRRHPIHLIFRMIPLIIIGVISLLILGYLALIPLAGMTTPYIGMALVLFFVFGLGIWFLLDWMNDYSILTNQRVLYKEKVILLYDSRQEAPLQAVLSVSATTDFWGRLLSFGDVSLRTYAGSINLPKVYFPRQVAALTETILSQVRKGQVQTEKETVDRLIRDKLGLNDQEEGQDAAQQPEDAQNQPDDRPATHKVKSSKLMNWLAAAFGLRLEKGDVTVYRKHWFILLSKTWLPSLLLLMLLALAFGRIFELYEVPSKQALLGLVFLIGLVISGWWIYRFVDWQNDQFIVTPDQLVDVDKKPLGKEERRAAPLKNVLSIEFERLGIIGLFLNFGTVYIRVGETVLTFDKVYDPSDVQRDLFRRLAERDQREKLGAKLANQEHVADWMAAYHRIVTDNGQSVPESDQTEEVDD